MLKDRNHHAGVYIGAWVSEELKQQLRDDAAEHNRTLSGQLIEILEKYFRDKNLVNQNIGKLLHGKSKDTA